MRARGWLAYERAPSMAFLSFKRTLYDRGSAVSLPKIQISANCLLHSLKSPDHGVLSVLLLGYTRARATAIGRAFSIRKGADLFCGVVLVGI